MFNPFFTQHYQTIIFASLSILFSSALFAEQKPYAPENIKDVMSVSAEEVIELILANPDLIVIDSRKKTEYQKGHIEGAVNILNTQLKSEDLERVSPDKTTEILFYCNGTRCLRSADSIKKAKAWGYTRLIWFRGGWKEWTEKRLPVVTD
ncbi:MAG: rhodanese-like domain-containing protein [Gammaproteobacteria bacterium]|nr:MAG: rhodanese-like domain-containing protein [Gammaproteobacteria bacterium]